MIIFKSISHWIFQLVYRASAVIYLGAISGSSGQSIAQVQYAEVIGKAVWDHKGDIRDVISIGKLVRKNDGPEEVEQILRTMVKYGEMKVH